MKSLFFTIGTQVFVSSSDILSQKLSLIENSAKERDMRQDWNLQYRVLEAALQVQDRVEVRGARTHRPQPTEKTSVRANPGWEAALQQAMQQTIPALP
jgi:hypothetical protein